MPSTPIPAPMRMALMQAILEGGPTDPDERLTLTIMTGLARLHHDDDTGAETIQYRRGATLLAQPMWAETWPKDRDAAIQESIDPVLNRLVEGGYIVMMREPVPRKLRRGRPPLNGRATVWQIVIGGNGPERATGAATEVAADQH
jgi:hypothetical protein